MNTIEILKNPYYFFAILTIVNVLFYLFTYFISSFWAQYTSYDLPQKKRSDFLNTLLILLVNILVSIPGFLLFKFDIITFTLTSNMWVETLVLLFIVDIAMYIVHIVAHKIYPFKTYHLRHHTHEEFNELSLYVMSPVESIGLAVIITTYLYVYSFNLYAVILFLLINWFWGVLAHINSEKTEASSFLGDNTFHQIHHKVGSVNFGFYTVIWDRLFKTYQKSLKQ